jgi:hypothetical protein
MKPAILKALNTAFIVGVLGASTVAHAQDEVDTRIGKLQLNLRLPTKEIGRQALRQGRLPAGLSGVPLGLSAVGVSG